jgi:hypothetical protein
MEDIINKALDKADIKSILGKDVLTYWDVKTLFEYVDKALKGNSDNAGLNYFASVSTQVQNDIEWAIVKTKQIAETIVKLENSIEEQLNKSYELTEERFNQYFDKVNALKKKAEEFHVVLPEARVPYGWNELLNMVEKLSHMSEEKQQAFYGLVERFKQIEQGV